MRIGTWNLEKYPRPTSEKWPELMDFLKPANVDIWLFTEVNTGWETDQGGFVVSPQRTTGREQERWAGIQTGLPMTPLFGGDGNPAAEEALCLARVKLPHPARWPSVLVACSVLPWSGALKDWPGLPSPSLDDQAVFVLEHHIARIEDARQEGEPVIWGGDFNQELKPLTAVRREAGFGLAGTGIGIGRLRSAFARLDLRPLTDDAEHLIEGAAAIDHLAVSWSIEVTTPVEVLRPPLRRNGKRLSDHAAYLAEIDL